MIVTQAVCSWQEASAITMEQNCKVHGVLIPHWNYPSANPCKHIYKMLFESVLIKISDAGDCLCCDAEIAVYGSE